MRRLAAIGVTFAATLAAARADIAPPPLQFIDVTAGDLTFLVIARDYTRPSRPTAQLVGCLDGRPNCALARAKGLVGRRVGGFDGRDFDPGGALRSQILAAFSRDGAPATIEIDFEPEDTGGEPLRVVFARR
ncbi:MAG: hypothetical protein ABSF67_23950 [Roseiarcus sp.]